MGETREEMTTTKKSENKVVDLRKDEKSGKGIVGAFGKLAGRRKAATVKQETIEEEALTFASMIEKADDRLDTLIVSKRRDLEKEKGEEAYNKKALDLLVVARHHLDGLINACADYTELKH
jgi:hypothetical protein